MLTICRLPTGTVQQRQKSESIASCGEESSTQGTSLPTGGEPPKIRGNYARFLTIFWNMVPVPQVSQQFWAQHQKKNTVRARSRAISNLFTVLQRKLTQGHTHRHAHAHTQHGTPRERNRRTRALSCQSLLQDSHHTETHTHAPKNTHTRTQRRTAHTRTGAQIYVQAQTRTHTVMIRFRCAAAVLFAVCHSTLERPT